LRRAKRPNDDYNDPCHHNDCRCRNYDLDHQRLGCENDD
jgi:hypothetical protein